MNTKETASHQDIDLASLSELLLSDLCICTRKCDCENPNPKEGVALLSQECPIHNFFPKSNPNCCAKWHWFELT